MNLSFSTNPKPSRGARHLLAARRHFYFTWRRAERHRSPSDEAAAYKVRKNSAVFSLRPCRLGGIVWVARAAPVALVWFYVLSSPTSRCRMDLCVSRNVRRVVRVHVDASGRREVETLYARKQRRSRRSPELRGLEKLVRRLGRAHRAFGDTYVNRHQQSNRKKRDGWLRDLGDNVSRAHRNAKLWGCLL
jgi:hypothetical protein